MWNISQSSDKPWHPTGPIQLGSRAGRECCKLWLVILRWSSGLDHLISIDACGQYQLVVSGLILTLHLTRNSGFHLLQTYLPSFIFVLLGWLGLFIPRTSVPGRVGMGMTTILTLTAMLRSAISSFLSTLPFVLYTVGWGRMCQKFPMSLSWMCGWWHVLSSSTAACLSSSLSPPLWTGDWSV